MSRDLFWSRRRGGKLDEAEPGRGDATSSSKAGGITQNIHPLVSVLSLHDLDSCVAVENAAFPENERCSKEKVTIFGFYLLHSITWKPPNSLKSNICSLLAHSSAAMCSHAFYNLEFGVDARSSTLPVAFRLISIGRISPYQSARALSRAFCDLAT